MVSEFATPARVGATDTGGLGQLPARNAAAAPHGVGYCRRAADGTWGEVTHAEFATDVDRLAKGFIAAGIEPGDRVGLMSGSDYHWTRVDFALLAAGAVVVPILPQASGEQVAGILRDSEARSVVVQDAELAAVVGGVRDRLPGLREVWTMDPGLTEVLDGELDVTDAELRQRTTATTRDTPATIVYTSGTTGRPRGVVLTHGNLLTPAENGVEQLRALLEVDDAATVLLLHPAHILARFFQMVAVYSRARLGHSAAPETALDDLAALRPTFVLAPPELLEQVVERARRHAEAGHRRRWFDRACDVLAATGTHEEGSGITAPVRRARQRVAAPLVRHELKRVTGGRLTHVLSGGAPLRSGLLYLFTGAGIPVLEGYGLTEAAGAVTVNAPGRTRIGTVGTPLPGSAVRVGDDGQVLVRGPGVFQGYLNDPEGTARTMTDDGWLRTGDLGRLDDDGYLRITGRRDDRLVTSTGLVVDPAPLEERLREDPLVGHCVVIGNGRPYLTALVSLAPSAVPAADRRPDGEPDLQRAGADPQVRAALDRAVERVNTTTGVAPGIRAVEVLPVRLSTANGYLTPSLKVRRSLVQHDFAEEIDALYRQDDR